MAFGDCVDACALLATGNTTTPWRHVTTALARWQTTTHRARRWTALHTTELIIADCAAKETDKRETEYRQIKDKAVMGYPLVYSHASIVIPLISLRRWIRRSFACAACHTATDVIGAPKSGAEAARVPAVWSTRTYSRRQLLPSRAQGGVADTQPVWVSVGRSATHRFSAHTASLSVRPSVCGIDPLPVGIAADLHSHSYATSVVAYRPWQSHVLCRSPFSCLPLSERY